MTDTPQPQAETADAPHRSVATEVILRNLFTALEKHHAGLTDEVLAAVSQELESVKPTPGAEQAFVDRTKIAVRAVLGKLPT